MVVILDAGQVFPVINAATTTGAQQQFGVRQTPDGQPRTLLLQAVGSTMPTTLTAQLQASNDGGTTFQNIGATLPIVATSTGAPQSVSGIVPGAVYQLNITALTLGSAGSVTVNAAVS